MELHTYPEEFEDLITFAAEAIGLPETYVEKDYWVTRALKYLSESELVDQVVFKGGTSLSKAYRLVERFSEDIDLAVFRNDRSSNALKKHIKEIEEVVNQGLSPIESPNNSKGGKYRRTLYEYPKTNDSNEFGHTSPHLVLEINAFTTPEPHETRQLSSLIAESLQQQARTDLIEQYGLEPFSVSVLSVKRTLTEKLLRIIKGSYSDDPVDELSRYIRHLYDVTMILREQEHKDFMAGPDFESLCTLCIEDDKIGNFSNSGCLDAPLLDAPLFSQFDQWQDKLENVYKNEFATLVHGDLPPFKEVTDIIPYIKTCLITR